MRGASKSPSERSSSIFLMCFLEVYLITNIDTGSEYKITYV
jgi:hypothetical protein